MTQIQICNAALRQLGVAKIVTLSDAVEQARILNDIYDMILDEVLVTHPWNFAIKRATLTVLGGLITTWTAQGTANVWQAALTTEPARVEFNGTEGTKKTSIATLTAEGYWYWVSNILYVYSTSDPDTAYVDSGIDAIIPEFDWDHAFALPSDCLRVVRMEDNAEFVKEGEQLFTDESEAKIKYIKQITDPTKYSPAFITVLAQRLAAEVAYPLTHLPDVATNMYKLYLERLRIGKGVDAQEGTAEQEDDSAWDESRG